ncbi:phosphatase PAP2 family protein [Conexibacter stalactiti]|uniref:Phosphatase PAP2 family protein n=1 Tax=Conexibacter stalactiti TaxID=1940611 RepID=A0ABU4HJW9_9ACTN|nr:phosphatase PAP2 family protein [Conexibacter stalactiti]MDW5593604.1 phosphatase PAP2 family protein [Conexibacter stalactiti]MEC5034245.1 phosphatase PAP2 family protein [Conexibacter stalactiti]
MESRTSAERRQRVAAPRGRPAWLRVLQIAAPLAWLAATVWFVAFEGLPLTRDWIAAWVVLGLLAFSLGDVGGWFRGVVLDWLPFFGILALYDLLRGVADGLIFEPFFLPQIDADEFLFGGQVPTVWLQERLYEPGALPWWGVIAWAVYMSHFFATPLLAGILWKVDRMRFRRYAVTVAALSLLGFATYALFPAAPPWMAAQDGLIPPVSRVIPELWGQLGIPARFGVVGTGYEYANDVAAVPSLHAAFSLLITLELWQSARRWPLRVLLGAYPLVMAFALVYSGEHYVVDILLGWIYAVVAFWGVRRAFARWTARRDRNDRNVRSGSFSVSTD